MKSSSEKAKSLKLKVINELLTYTIRHNYSYNSKMIELKF